MAQADLNVANQSGAGFRADLNNQLLALGTLQSGASAPSTTYAYMLWADTANDLLKIRNAANSAFISLGTLSATNLGNLPTSGGTLTGALLASSAGNAAAPALSVAGDTDTGIFGKAANQLGISTAGVLRAWFDSAGVNLDAQGDTRYWDSDSSNYVAFQAPATVASNVTWTLPNADGTSGQALVTDGSGVLSFGGVRMTLATAVNTTSGTAIDFTGIPSWVKRVTVMFNAVSTNGTSNLVLQSGAGSIQSSNYSSSALNQSGTAVSSVQFFVLTSGITATATLVGQAVISLVGSNTWVLSSVITNTNAGSGHYSAGNVVLSGTLDRVRITTVSGDTFDAGSINILYEG